MSLLIKIDWNSESSPKDAGGSAKKTLLNSSFVKGLSDNSKPLLIFFETKKRKPVKKKKKKSRKRKAPPLTSQAILSEKIDNSVFLSTKWLAQLGALYFNCIRIDVTDIEPGAEQTFFNTKTAPQVILVGKDGKIKAMFKTLSIGSIVNAMHKIKATEKMNLKATINRLKANLTGLYNAEKRRFLLNEKLEKLKKKKKLTGATKKKIKAMIKKIEKLEEVKNRFIEKYKVELKKSRT